MSPIGLLVGLSLGSLTDLLCVRITCRVGPESFFSILPWGSIGPVIVLCLLLI